MPLLCKWMFQGMIKRAYFLYCSQYENDFVFSRRIFWKMRQLWYLNQLWVFHIFLRKPIRVWQLNDLERQFSLTQEAFMFHFILECQRRQSVCVVNGKTHSSISNSRRRVYQSLKYFLILEYIKYVYCKSGEIINIYM